MSRTTPIYTRKNVNEAGDILREGLEQTGFDALDRWLWATDVLANWRLSHDYPINTFQATLRGRLQRIDRSAMVAQRLKRTPSVIRKLQKNVSMRLTQMQDIGGIRAVVSNMETLRMLEEKYRDSHLQHPLHSSKDYINRPKVDGYRSVHLIYTYSNKRASIYNGIHVELQIRTYIQHAWATAVESVEVLFGQAFKSGEGDSRWREFFKVASAALAHVENTPIHKDFENLSRRELFTKVAELEASINAIAQLRAATVAFQAITSEHSAFQYHVIVLDLDSRKVFVEPFSRDQLEEAGKVYSHFEELASKGQKLNVVLASAGPILSLKRAYPNYWLDTHAFVSSIEEIIVQARTVDTDIVDPNA